jgi:stage V sporulation protein S
MTALEVEDGDSERLIRVSGATPPQAVAKTILAAIFESQRVPVVRAIGAGAVCQACKGIAIARGLVATRGRDLATTIGFETIQGARDETITAQTFHLFLR